MSTLLSENFSDRIVRRMDTFKTRGIAETLKRILVEGEAEGRRRQKAKEGRRLTAASRPPSPKVFSHALLR
jgi:hypothetical protein